MDEIKDFFKESHESFTVYVVEQRFVVGRGYEYFKSFRGKENFIGDNASIRRRIKKILDWLCSNIPHIGELVRCIFTPSPSLGITDIIVALSKLFSVQEHQAVGPDVLDPILIQEECIDKKYLTQLITLHKSSILQPVIIILLKDNDIERAKLILSNCPHGINVKMIRNSGKSELFKVINTGAEDVDSFIDAYARQCFSSCSRTPSGILLNKEWSQQSLVKQYTPLIFKIRSSLLFDDKLEVKNDILNLKSALSNTQSNGKEQILINTLRCILDLFQVYCNDFGGTAIVEALRLARELDNEILLAHVYRYAHFLPQCTLSDRRELLTKAQQIFTNNKIEDNAIYCLNNNLIHDFYKDSVNVRAFRDMQQEAVNNVPGLVGMSIIYNNTGVAYLYKGEAEEAITYFTKGLEYARDRLFQKIGLMCNRLIAKDYGFMCVEENEIRKVVNYIFDTCGTTRLPFITANNIMNVLAIALKQHPGLANDLLVHYPIKSLIKAALTPNQMGSGSLALQISILDSKYKEFRGTMSDIEIPSLLSSVSGIRLNFLQRHDYNPAISNAWL